MMTFSKSLSLTTISTTSKNAGIGALFGLGAATLICLAAWLSPLAAQDRPALALIAIAVALPLGAAAGATGLSAASLAARGLAAGFALATMLTVFTFELWTHAVLWCCAAALIGSALAGFGRVAAVAAAAGWLMLCGLPFFYDSMPVLRGTAADWALTGCPWLGFSHSAIGGDPLRRPVLYLGQLSGLSDQPVYGLLTAGTLWIAAALAWSAHVVKSVRLPRKRAAEPEATT
jgi:hypothetical protein